MNTDHIEDEDLDQPTRPEILTRASLTKTRTLGSLSIRPLTAETLSYLFEVKNFYVSGLRGERVNANNANAIWATAEFIYIHAADPDEVASVIWNADELRKSVRAMLADELNDPKVLSESLPIIEQMVTEYFAAQSEAKANPAATMKASRMGKGPARRGKRAT